MNRTVDQIIENYLSQKGIDTVDKRQFYINPNYRLIENTWKQIPGIEMAIQRIKTAIKNKEPICIYGDFDVDGLTATAILFKTLKYLGGKGFVYIPNRITEGHSLNRSAIKNISKKASLIITVDCGVTSFQEIEYTNYLGIDVIITDHHFMENKIPNAHSIITPPPELLTDFSGAGMSFKLCQGLLNNTDHELIPELITFAALGTITDCVEQNNENRVITNLGLRYFSEVKSPGLQQIIKNSNCKHPISEYDISWKISPRLNSASRLGKVSVASHTLFCENKLDAVFYADQLEKMNTDRKKIVEEFFKICRSKIFDSSAIILKFSDFVTKDNFKLHKGIQGILASKICGEYSKPTFIFSETSEGILEGSARSLPGYSLTEIIEETRDLLISGGGHDLAGGMSLYLENLKEFKIRIHNYISNKQLIPLSQISLVLPLLLSEVSFDLYSKILSLEPFGNEGVPIWLIKSKLSGQPKLMGSEGKHLSFQISDKKNKVRVIGWGMGHRIKELSNLKNLELQCQIVLNEYQGHKSIELHLKNFSGLRKGDLK